MKTVGIIGGIGPESTIDYYRKIVAAFCEYDTNGNYPRIIINSINMNEMLKRLGAGKLDEIADNLIVEFGKLEAAGADFGILASNTPHIVFDKVRDSSALPLISIVEVTCNKVKEIGLREICQNGRFFRQTLEGQKNRKYKPYNSLISMDGKLNYCRFVLCKNRMKKEPLEEK